MIDKKEAGYLLFKEGYTQQAIADVLGVALRTVNAWKKKLDWDERRRRETLRENNTTDMVWDLYQYNLEVLTRRVADWRKEGLDEMITKGDVDALQKFYVQVKDKSIAWNTYVRVIRELKAYLAQENLALAKKLEDTKLVDDFLNLKRGEV